jgi:membrane protein YdbS with pleckstrin-like domain
MIVDVMREFGVDVGLVGLYRVYLVLVLFGGFLWWMVPVAGYVLLSSFWVGIVVTLAFLVPVFVAAGVVLFWIPRFCSSVRYVLEDDKVVVVKGVWWRSKSFVPYNRITNVNVYQGPVSRSFGLGKVSIQTAGFSSASSGGGKVAEAVVFGIKNFEEVKDVVMDFVKGLKPEAVEAEAKTRPSKDTDQLILAELQKIRKALEK